jgi:hypothetical protein
MPTLEQCTRRCFALYFEDYGARKPMNCAACLAAEEARNKKRHMIVVPRVTRTGHDYSREHKEGTRRGANRGKLANWGQSGFQREMAR